MSIFLPPILVPPATNVIGVLSAARKAPTMRAKLIKPLRAKLKDSEDT